MHSDLNTTLTELREALTLTDDLGLLEGKPVSPEKFKKVLPALAKRTEKLVLLLEDVEPDYVDPSSVTEKVERYYRDAVQAAQKADKLITKLVKSVKSEARRYHGTPRGMGDYDPPDDGPERENTLDKQDRARLKKFWQMANALTQGVLKLADDVEGKINPKTFSVFEDYAAELEELESSLRMACRELKIKGV